MEKQEYRLKAEQMLKYLKGESYEEALAIADSMEWTKVKNASVLCAVSEVYEHCGQIEKSREILFVAYDYAPESKKIVYRLGILALKLGQLKEAMDCYEEFVTLAPKDPNRFVLKYKILKAKGAPLEEQIALLEEFKKVEYVEKWAFELALLYQQAGMISECLEECDDLILWFSEGTYIYKAMELKMQYKPLTPIQQEKYARYQELSKPAKVVEEVQEEVAAEPAEEEAPVQVAQEEPAAEVVEVEEVEEITEETQEETQEEVLEETLAQEEVAEEQPAAETKETKLSSSIEQMLQNWQEQQKENAQIIQEQLQKVEQEKALNEQQEKEEEKEEILPDDVRSLMEQLEAESAEIAAQKTAVEEVEEAPKPLLQKVVEQISSLEAILDRPEKQPAEVPVEKEVPKLVVEEEDLKVGDTQAISMSAKALEKAVPIELPEIEIPTDDIFEETFNKKTIELPKQKVEKKAAGPYATEFVVHGKYDLDSQSAVGLQAGLSEEQKKLFSYFVPVRGVSEQLVKVLENDKQCTSRYGTSRIGNVVIVGRKGSGKTVLAVNVVKAIQQSRKMKAGKVAIIKAEALNKKDVKEIVQKLHGGALVIEKAARLNKDAIESLCSVMEGQTGELLVVLEDERKPIDRMFADFPNFKKKFTSRIELPVFINDELVTFGQTYAKENGYKIDDTAILTLYSDIDILQREEKIVTVTDVKLLVDGAIENANRFGFKKIFKKLFGRYRDESGRIILREEDFK